MQCPRLIPRKLYFRQIRETADVGYTFGEGFALCDVAEVAFKDIPGSLEVHYGVLSLKGVVGCDLVHGLRDS